MISKIVKLELVNCSEASIGPCISIITSINRCWISRESWRNFSRLLLQLLLLTWRTRVSILGRRCHLNTSGVHQYCYKLAKGPGVARWILTFEKKISNIEGKKFNCEKNWFWKNYFNFKHFWVPPLPRVLKGSLKIF